ncbi:dual specificity phosphatase [Trichuris trichiura]|uniref:Phosphatidylglycerophosphatase and protein-tyrosine phosphatase 1 n=1 Tax=Trichuris trichiura TaxID=36087 RepID=A0A077Z283_TRITR|nr:dual specificity phosphatase [Trichuris trichiura]
MTLLENLAFYPSLFYSLLRNRLSSIDWPWYNRIDETVILGALPFKSMINELIEKEHVGGILCTTEPHEVEHSWAAAKQDWEAKGVSYYWLPIRDFFYTTDTSNVHDAVKFIRNFENSGKSVYVHCKAGRTRSTMIVLCYLMEKNKWYSPAAYTLIKSKRPRIVLYHQQWTTIEDYAKKYVWGKNQTSNM